ncbi:peroxidase-like [Plutella xylostella]|uniref:peroxidase-like n=1 Tax=Plutella xylostella TaxID=51655 RepID=UPI002032C6A0|nr:peroxidase-like [Plutella xylostella]
MLKQPYTELLQTILLHPGNDPRPARSGRRLPLARVVRTGVLPEGQVSSQVLTQLASYYLAFVAADVTSLHDTVNYILWKPYCCEEKGKLDRECTPNEVPVDDPVHRHSGLRCLNLTRPMSFQSTGCLPNDTVPTRITSSTPLFDMSGVYGNTQKELADKGRLFQRGLLKYEVDDSGRIWPPSTKTPVDLCLLNQKPVETRCHDGPSSGMNSIFGVNMMSIWFWREHNRIAEELSNMNPCWDDEKTFHYARDISIATYLQILYYELLPLLMGRKSLIKDGVISSTPDHRDLYNEQYSPQMSSEFLMSMRWTHNLQETKIKLMEENGKVVGEYPMVNLTLRTGYLALGRHMEQITQGSFRQPGAKADHLIDPDVTELALGPHQRSSDVATSDLAKNRLAGLSSYTSYLEFCRGRPYNTFESLLEVMDNERIEKLRELYECVEDIDLLAGMWAENLVPGGFVPHTFYCLVSEHLVRNVVSDRHWYERAERPLAFSAHQLREVRNATMARLLCDNGDSVRAIQPRAFERIAPGNDLVSCDQIPPVNLVAWKDRSCHGHYMGYRH